jgi:translation elongation factor EF-1alpha
MGKKCKKCGVPLEGFMYEWVTSKLFGVRPSAKDASVCNKCVSSIKEVVQGKEIGVITHYYSHLNVGIIELSDSVKVGNRIRIKGHTTDTTQNIDSMQINHNNVNEARKGDLIGIKVSGKVHPNDKVYKI